MSAIFVAIVSDNYALKKNKVKGKLRRDKEIIVLMFKTEIN